MALKDPISDKQRAFVLTLLDDRAVPDEFGTRVFDALDTMTKGQASRVIDDCKRFPFKKQAQAQAQATQQNREVTVTEPGVYETPAGKIYVVKPNKQKTRLYAKQLVEIDAERATEAGERVQIEFEYAAGAIFELAPGMKMPLERAKELTIRYGRCIVCGRGLKAAKSVEQGIGPVCIKSFAGAEFGAVA